jgi:DNA-binding HxlR family transcriptional regulator
MRSRVVFIVHKSAHYGSTTVVRVAPSGTRASAQCRFRCKCGGITGRLAARHRCARVRLGSGALARAVPGISDSVLSDRLGELTGAGLITQAVTEGPPVSVTYTLTRAGRELLPALEQIGRWAERHLTSHGVRSSATPESALRQARRRSARKRQGSSR